MSLLEFLVLPSGVVPLWRSQCPGTTAGSADGEVVLCGGSEVPLVLLRSRTLRDECRYQTSGRAPLSCQPGTDVSVERPPRLMACLHEGNEMRLHVMEPPCPTSNTSHCTATGHRPPLDAPPLTARHPSGRGAERCLVHVAYKMATSSRPVL